MTSFGIAIPQTVEAGGFDGPALQAFLGRAEELGFESAWTQEQVIGDYPGLGSLELLAYAAACTTRMRLGVRRARQARSTVPCTSPRAWPRSTTSAGAASRSASAPGAGSACSRRSASTGTRSWPASTRASPLMRALWSEERIDHDGRFWQLAGAAMEPKPVQRPAPPRLVRRRPSQRPPPGRRPGGRVLRRRLARRPPTSRSRWRHGGGRRWPRPAGTHRRSASPSGCTSPWTTTPAGPGSACPPRGTASTASSGDRTSRRCR